MVIVSVLFGVLFRQLFPVLMNSNLLPDFSSIRSNIDVRDPVRDKFCTGRWIRMHFHSSTFSHPVWPARLLKMLPFPQCVFFFCPFVKTRVSVGVWTYVWVVSSIPLVGVFVLCHCHGILFSPVVGLGIWGGDTSSSSFINQKCFSLDFFVFPYKVESFPFKICEE